jgi:hypothetical protein
MFNAVAVCALLLPVLSQAQVKLLRHPTYSKGKVAFSYLGDIWIANEDGSGVMHLTDNEARDQSPPLLTGWQLDRVLLQSPGQRRCLRDPCDRR